MADNDKISVSVYQLNLNRFEETEFEKIVAEAVKKANEGGAGLVPERLQKKKFGEHQVLIFSSYFQYPPRWRGFIEPILHKESRLSSCQNKTFSYVCFIGFADHIFAISGGLGSHAIARFTTHNFGLEILVRLFNRDNKVIKAIQDRGLTGSILGQTKFYRGDQRFSDEDQFGKIFTEVKAELNEQKLTKTFGFPVAGLRKKVSGCLAKSSFQINKAVDFETLLSLTERFTEILKLKEKFSLNRVTLLNNRNPDDKKLRGELDDWLCDQIYSECKKEAEPDVDFCHKDFERYLTASSYSIMLNDVDVIEFDDLFKLGDLIRELKRKGCYADEDIHQFRYHLLLRHVESLDDEGIIITRGTVLEHIHGEVQYKEKNYFRIDGEWYLIHPSFIKDLNTECDELLNDAWDEHLITEIFDGKKERKFNLKFYRQRPDKI